MRKEAPLGEYDKIIATLSPTQRKSVRIAFERGGGKLFQALKAEYSLVPGCAELMAELDNKLFETLRFPWNCKQITTAINLCEEDEFHRDLGLDPVFDAAWRVFSTLHILNTKSHEPYCYSGLGRETPSPSIK